MSDFVRATDDEIENAGKVFGTGFGYSIGQLDSLGFFRSVTGKAFATFAPGVLGLGTDALDSNGLTTNEFIGVVGGTVVGIAAVTLGSGVVIGLGVGLFGEYTFETVARVTGLDDAIDGHLNSPTIGSASRRDARDANNSASKDDDTIEYRGAPDGFSVPTSAYSPADGQRVFDRGVEALEGPEATGLQGQVHPDSWWSGATAGDLYEAVNDPFLQARVAHELGLEFPPEFRIDPQDPLLITIDPSTFAPGTPVMAFMAGAQVAPSVNLPGTVFSRFLDSLFGPANARVEIKHPSELDPP